MSAYVIVDIDVKDPVIFEEYKKLSPNTLAQYGGRYLARGGNTDILEGSWIPNRLVVIEFESVENARAWFNSPEYKAARSVRLKSAETQMVLIEGWQPPA